MAEEKQRPWGKWYWGDWRKDARLRRCCYGARGLWADMLSLMGGECDRFGYLVMEGQPLGVSDLAGLLGGSIREVTKLLDELSQKWVFSRIGDESLPEDIRLIVATDLPVGTIFSRRMIRDKAKEERDRANGKGGGNPHLKGGVNHQDKAHSQKPEPLPKPVAAEEAPAEEIVSQTNRLERLLGLDETDYVKHVRNVEAVVNMRQEGCDFDRHILKAAEAIKPGAARSISYIRPKAIELRDAERAVKSMPTPFENTDERGWRDRIDYFQSSGRWSSKWGPNPTDPGCRAPSHLTKKDAA